jgi:hypothetical protein
VDPVIAVFLIGYLNHGAVHFATLFLKPVETVIALQIPGQKNR